MSTQEEFSADSQLEESSDSALLCEEELIEEVVRALPNKKKKLPTRLNNPVMTLLLESSEDNLIEISLPKVRTNRRKKNPNHLKGYVLD